MGVKPKKYSYTCFLFHLYQISACGGQFINATSFALNLNQDFDDDMLMKHEGLILLKIALSIYSNRFFYDKFLLTIYLYPVEFGLISQNAIEVVRLKTKLLKKNPAKFPLTYCCLGIENIVFPLWISFRIIEQALNLDEPDGFCYYRHNLRHEISVSFKWQYGEESAEIRGGVTCSEKNSSTIFKYWTNSKGYKDILSENLLLKTSLIGYQ